ncbi:hypothetical protein V5799_015816, partial [Amblyomma americanum]
LPPEDPRCGGVGFRARPASQRHSSHEQEAAVHLVTPVSNGRAQMTHGTENETAAVRA